jgi:predicted glutamine amidotransferase
VRASTGGATSRMNCHPFTAGRWSFMHNGQIGGFERIRRPLENSLSDAGFAQREGTTDSELFFS